MQWVAAKPGKKSGGDGCAEGSSSGGKTSATLSPERQTMNSDVAKQGNDNDCKDGDICGFYAWLSLLLEWSLSFGEETPT